MTNTLGTNEHGNHVMGFQIKIQWNEKLGLFQVTNNSGDEIARTDFRGVSRIVAKQVGDDVQELMIGLAAKSITNLVLHGTGEIRYDEKGEFDGGDKTIHIAGDGN